MKTIFKSRYPTMTPASAGFGAIMNNAVVVCEYHVKKYANYDILIDVDEINNLFDYNLNYDISEYKHDIEPEFMSEIINGKYDIQTHAHMICNKELLLNKHNIYKKFFRLKNLDWYNEQLENYIDDKTLSIQIRGTDKWTEVGHLNPENIKNHINRMIDENGLNSIFISTDDVKWLKFVKENFNHLKVKFTEKKISYDGRPIHFDFNNRATLNQQLMLDVFLLSKSKFFLYCFSNVSYLALIMGLPEFKKIDCINQIQ